MNKDKLYYLIDENSIEPVKVIEELPKGAVNVKNPNSNNTYWVSECDICDTEEEAYKKLLRSLEYNKEETENTIYSLKEELVLINQTIKNLKQKYEI